MAYSSFSRKVPELDTYVVFGNNNKYRARKLILDELPIPASNQEIITATDGMRYLVDYSKKYYPPVAKPADKTKSKHKDGKKGK